MSASPHANIIREIAAAIGGIVFIIIGIARQRERKRLLNAGQKAEGPLVWSILIIAGIGLIIFACGLMIYQLNRN